MISKLDIPPAVRWFGGKQMLAPLLCEIIGDIGSCYVEPYAGAGAVFLNTSRRETEVLNDTDPLLVSLYRVLASEEGHGVLYDMLARTPYSNAAFLRAYVISQTYDRWSDVLRAWAIMVLANQSVSAKCSTASGWGRTKRLALEPGRTDRKTFSPISAWTKRPDSIPRLHERIRWAIITQEDAIDCIRRWDSESTTFYIDPPYLPQLCREKCNKFYYSTKTNLAHHKQLVEAMLASQGYVMATLGWGDIYQPLLDAGWKKIDLIVPTASYALTPNMSRRAIEKRRPDRIETIVVNPKLWEATQAKAAFTGEPVRFTKKWLAELSKLRRAIGC